MSDKPKDELVCIFRRGKATHIKSLFEKGEIYINTISSIRKYDKNWERSDKQDSISFRQYYASGTIEICEVGKEFETDGKKLDVFNAVLIGDDHPQGNIYCMSGIFSDQIDSERDLEFDTNAFGESLIFIFNPKEFVSRIVIELESLGYVNVEYGRVEYFENDFSGIVGLFSKHERFKHQSEFRIFIPNTLNTPIKLSIGSISDIAVVSDTGINLKAESENGNVNFIKIK